MYRTLYKLRFERQGLKNVLYSRAAVVRINDIRKHEPLT